MPLTTILSIFSTTAIVAAGIFAGVQLRLYNKQRARDSALQLVHSFRTPEFLRAVNIVFELPEGLSKEELEARLGDKMVDLLVMFGTFESLGIRFRPTSPSGIGANDAGALGHHPMLLRRSLKS